MRKYIPYIRENLNKEASLGALARFGMKTAKFFGGGMKAMKTGAKIGQTVGKVGNTAMNALNVASTGLMAKDIYDSVRGGGGGAMTNATNVPQNQQQPMQNNQMNTMQNNQPMQNNLMNTMQNNQPMQNNLMNTMQNNQMNTR